MGFFNLADNWNVDIVKVNDPLINTRKHIYPQIVFNHSCCKVWQECFVPKQALGTAFSKYLKHPFTTQEVSLTVPGLACVPSSQVYYTEFVYELAGFSFTLLNGVHCVSDVLGCLRSALHKWWNQCNRASWWERRKACESFIGVQPAQRGSPW